MRDNIVCLNYIWAFKIKTLRQRTTACKQYCLAAGATQGNIAYTQNVIGNKCGRLSVRQKALGP